MAGALFEDVGRKKKKEWRGWRKKGEGCRESVGQSVSG